MPHVCAWHFCKFNNDNNKDATFLRAHNGKKSHTHSAIFQIIIKEIWKYCLIKGYNNYARIEYRFSIKTFIYFHRTPLRVNLMHKNPQIIVRYSTLFNSWHRRTFSSNAAPNNVDEISKLSNFFTKECPKFSK